MIPVKSMFRTLRLSTLSAACLLVLAGATLQAQQPAAPAANEPSSAVETYIPNGNGSFTVVTLQKTDKGFLGPQGEFYADHPTEEQLKARYCKK